MPQKRGIGKKFSTNYVKIAILLFLGDQIKTTSEIIRYLNEEFGISKESNMAKIHLGKLYQFNMLDKETIIGIETKWYWKKNPNSFGKIINFIHDNPFLVQDIVERKYSPQVNNVQDDIELELKQFFQSISPEFNADKYWFNLEYVRGFLTTQTIDHFVNKAYKKYCTNTQHRNVKSKEDFVFQVLENRDYDILQVLLYYSPNFVLYLTNLEKHYDEIINAKKIMTGIIFSTIMRDILVNRLISSKGSTAINIGTKWTSDHKGLTINMNCLLSNPGMINANS
jgi:hypothetical protein